MVGERLKKFEVKLDGSESWGSDERSKIAILCLRETFKIRGWVLGGR